MSLVSETTTEEANLEWLEELGSERLYLVANAAPSPPSCYRGNWQLVTKESR